MGDASMRIAVVGCGYVGLVTAACLAELGHEVVGVDDDTHKITLLSKGQIPIFESHLAELVAGNVKRGRLKFTRDIVPASQQAEVIFICVGTPPLENGEADLSAIDKVARAVANNCQTYKLVVEKSTVPVRTGHELERILRVYGARSGFTYDVASNPEFLREGTAVEDFLHPDRIVIGAQSEKARAMLEELYRPILEQTFKCPVHRNCVERPKPRFLATDIASAELIKHASNSFLALKISYVNVLADLCETFGADVTMVAEGMGADRRIGHAFLRPGIGFGGFCFPKDLQAFIRIAERGGHDFALLREAEKINLGRIDHFVEKLRSALWVIADKQIAVLGLSFKPNTDDIRFSPALAVVSRLLEHKAKVRVYDPKAMEKTKQAFPQLTYCRDAYEAASGSEALLLTTEWEDFRTLDWARIRESMGRALVLDGRNFLDAKELAALGFEYHSIGRPKLP